MNMSALRASVLNWPTTSRLLTFFHLEAHVRNMQEDDCLLEVFPLEACGSGVLLRIILFFTLGKKSARRKAHASICGGCASI